MASLGLNEHHQGSIVNYLRFARYQRHQRLKSVDGCFKDIRMSRLTETTYTVDDVTDLLASLLESVRTEVDGELSHLGHTNVLLLMQMFQQAEKWHLKLQADISELENRELLEKIKNFEEMEFSGTSRDTEFKPALKLEPLNETGGTALLNMEIQRINDENDRLRERMKQLENQALVVAKEKTQLQSQLDKTTAELAQFKGHGNAKGDSEEVAKLRATVSGLQMSMDKNASATKEQAGRMETDLSTTKHELLKIREMLDLAEKELEKKVSQTAPFKNLKQMLQKKNDQIKELRKRLSKYEEVAPE